MKTIDKLIGKYSTLMNTQVAGSLGWLNYGRFIQDLERLKTELKEQHKKDVMNAYNDCHSNTKAEQYYNQNH